jgi:hypothetical protein
MNAYRAVRWYLDTNGRGYFPAGTISFSDFRSKRKLSPVVAGSTTLNSSQNYTIPMFNNFYVTTVAGQGGQGGINGNCAGAGYGSGGGGTSLADYVSVVGGSGGAPSGGGGTQLSASTSVSIDDSNQTSVIARYGQVKYATVGAGGSGGSQGFYTRSEFICTKYVYYYGVPVCQTGYTAYYCDQGAGGGAGGANGYISISWN